MYVPWTKFVYSWSQLGTLDASYSCDSNFIEEAFQLMMSSFLVTFSVNKTATNHSIDTYTEVILKFCFKMERMKLIIEEKVSFFPKMLNKVFKRK